MLKSCSGELARKSTWTCLSCSTLARSSSPSVIAASKNPASVHVHQRKQSSSKTSSSPEDEPASIPATTNAASDDTKPAVSSEADKAPTSRPRRRKAKDGAVVEATSDREGHGPQLNLPYVPSTQRVHPLGIFPINPDSFSRYRWLIQLSHSQDIHVASFFSQHRPISVSQVIPPATTTEAFSSLFNPAKPAQKSKAQDVIYILSSAVDTLDQAVASQQESQPPQQDQTPEELDLRAAVAQAQSQAANSPETHHLDNLPAKSLHINLQELAKNFRPFVPPPPPVPMGALREASGRRKATGREQQQQQQATKQTTWTSTLTVYESTHANGRKTYKTYATPITRMPTSRSSAKGLPQGSQELDVVQHEGPHLSTSAGQEDAEHDNLPQQQEGEEQRQEQQQETRYLPRASTLQPFLSRMQARQLGYADRLDARFGRMQLQEGEDGMQAISVKRQRKLKMKKHKYKKLMKRTKNLRRRLDKT